jgi:hypothetical protein
MGMDILSDVVGLVLKRIVGSLSRKDEALN